MLNVYSALNNGTSVNLLMAQQQELLASQQTAVQGNDKTAAAVEELQQQDVQQADFAIQRQASHQTSPIGHINSLGQVTGSFVNESV